MATQDSLILSLWKEVNKNEALEHLRMFICSNMFESGLPLPQNVRVMNYQVTPREKKDLPYVSETGESGFNSTYEIHVDVYYIDGTYLGCYHIQMVSKQHRL
jgi:hypothetical protein